MSLRDPVFIYTHIYIHTDAHAQAQFSPGDILYIYQNVLHIYTLMHSDAQAQVQLRYGYILCSGYD